jgi:hypothetical protein
MPAARHQVPPGAGAGRHGGQAGRKHAGNCGAAAAHQGGLPKGAHAAVCGARAWDEKQLRTMLQFTAVQGFHIV